MLAAIETSVCLNHENLTMHAMLIDPRLAHLSFAITVEPEREIISDFLAATVASRPLLRRLNPTPIVNRSLPDRNVPPRF